MVRSKNHEAPQFSPAACHFLSFQAHISSPAPNLQTPCSLCSSLNILDQVSLPCKTGNFMVLFILIFMPLDRWENKRLWTQLWHSPDVIRFNLLLLSLYIQFSLSATPRCLNVATYSKDLLCCDSVLHSINEA